MKEFKLSIPVFFITFLVTYMVLCFLVPSLRLKLHAEPIVYFVKSIHHMSLLKMGISVVAGVTVGAVPIYQCKKQS